MKKPEVFRRRYIPEEIVDISGDELLKRDEDLLVTRWVPIKPRSDFSRGVSYTFLKDGYKISKFLSEAGELLYWYCDIIEVVYDKERDAYTLCDLLIDVKITTDGRVMVLDTDELALALRKGLVTPEQVSCALETLDRLLKMIYEGRFPPEVLKQNGD